MGFTYGIIGLGIMGGSIAKALKSNVVKDDQMIFALDKNSASLEDAKKQGIINKAFLPEQTEEFLGACDFVFICLYPHVTVSFLKEHKNHFKNKAIITDISGVKNLYLENYDSLCPSGADFILGHPMAGGEKEGFSNSNGSYFINHNYIIIEDKSIKTPEGISQEEHKKNLEFFKELVQKMGFSKITVTDCNTHDNKIGFTSQLCHVVASAMVESAEDKEITSFGGGSFEDLTRIAMINSPLWTELFLSNKEKLLAHISNFKNQITKIETLIKEDKKEELEDLLNDVRRKRIDMQK